MRDKDFYIRCIGGGADSFGQCDLMMWTDYGQRDKEMIG
jgi:hypothetical protein